MPQRRMQRERVSVLTKELSDSIIALEQRRNGMNMSR
jgi:hypothetical protein